MSIEFMAEGANGGPDNQETSPIVPRTDLDLTAPLPFKNPFTGEPALPMAGGAVDTTDPRLATAEARPTIPPIDREDIQGQIDWIAQQMSVLELTGRSYGEFQYDPVYMNLRQALHGWSREANDYANARIYTYEGFLITPRVGADVATFMKLGETAGQMKYADILLQQKKIAKAFMRFEIKSKNKYKIVDGKEVVDRESNPALAKEFDLVNIREDIALDLASGEERARLGQILQRVGGDKNNSEYKKERARLAQPYMGEVRLAETIWRMWLRSVLNDGIIFKAGVSQADRDRITSMRPFEIAEEWDEVKSKVDLSQSFDGSSEFATARLMWGALYAEKRGYGEAKVRPHLYYGQQDFVSFFLDEKFLLEPRNFRNGTAFSIERGREGDGSTDRVYSRINRDGEREIITIKRNGVVEFDENNPIDPGDIIWTNKGEGASYLGAFSAYKLLFADKIREAELSPEKLARDPSLKNLLEIYGLFEGFETITKDMEEHPEDPEYVEKQRKNGKIYKEDIFQQLAIGLLDFQKHDFYKRYKQKNINAEDVHVAVEFLRSKGMVTDEQAEEITKKLITFVGKEVSEVAQKFIVAMYILEPGSVFGAMMGSFIKQIAPPGPGGGGH